jgi:outer membrane protein insertion porin family
MNKNRASMIGGDRNRHGLLGVAVLCLAMALGGLAVYGQSPSGPPGGGPTDQFGPPGGPSLGPNNGEFIPAPPPLGRMPSLAPPPGPMPGENGPPQGPPPGGPLRPGDIPPGAAGAGQLPPGGNPAGAETVAEVRVTGNSKVALEKILTEIHTHAGRPFNSDMIDEDVRRLTKDGKFISVRPFTMRTPQGLVVIFEVIEKPILHYVKYVGCDRVGKHKLAEEAKIKPGDAMDPYAVEDARRAMEDYYHGHGYPRARVTIIEGNRPTDRGAIFLIDEGQKQAVLWVDFINNTIVSQARLRTQIKSTPGILWLFGGNVERKEIDEDINRLTAYYRSMGFFDCRIGRQLHYNDAQNWLLLTFVIQEGPRYQVRNVTFVGNTMFPTPKLAETVKLKDTTVKEPVYFSQAQMKADVLAIQDLYGGDGYVFCDVKADPRYLEQKGWMDLVYKIKEGERYRVGKINVVIKGEYPHTRINTVLNRLGCIRPGEIADTREMRKAEVRLKASQLFEVDPKTGAAPKIAFSPPGLGKSDDDELVADAPGKPAGVRRQSPDGPPAGPLPPATAANAAGPQERTIDVTVEGTWIGGDIPDEPPNWKEGQPQQAPPSAPPAPPAMRPTAYGAPWTAPPSGGCAADNGPVPGPRTCLTSCRIRRDAPGGNDDELEQAAAMLRLALLATVRPPLPPGEGRGEGTDVGLAVPAATQAVGWDKAATAAAGPPSAGNGALAGVAAGANNAPPFVPRRRPEYVVRGYNPDGGVSFPAPGPAYNPVSPAPVDGLSGPNVAFSSQLPPPPGSTSPPPGGYGQVPVADPALGGVEPYSGPGLGDAPALPLFPQLIETRTGRFMVSVGVNSDAGLVGSITIDEQNFDWTRWPTSWEDVKDGVAWRGNGERLQIQLVPGTELQRYSVTWQNPNLMDSDVGLGLNAYYFQRQYTDWFETWLGGRVSLGYQFAQGLSGSLAYRFAQVNVYDLDINAAPGGKPLPELQSAVGHPNYVNGFSATLSNDTRDNAFLATQGHFIEAQVEEVVGTFQYPRAQFDARQYFLISQRPDTSGRQVLSLNGHVGWTGDNTPIYDELFAGGFSSLRGFEFRGAGPHDNSVSVGGDFEVLAGVEYLFPITADDMLRGVLFLDTGTVEPSITNMKDHYRVAPGFGMRITIPAMGPAPIALDFAFPIALNHGDEVNNFSFFVGFLR